MRLNDWLLRSRRHTAFGRPLIRRTSTRRSRRDPSTHSSDRVWSLVEAMMNGDSDAAAILEDVIEEGVSAGKTKFVRVTTRTSKHRGVVHQGGVRPGEFAAITPGRSIVLFGIKRRYPRSGPPNGLMQGYVRRFRIGDPAEYNSYNLVYYGPILTITPQRVTISKGRNGRTEEKAALSIERFSTKNWDFDPAAAAKRNSEWTD